MNYQEIIPPVYPIRRIGLNFTNDGEIEVFYILSPGVYNHHTLKIIRRRFPDGRVSWFEEVKQ